MEESEQLSNRKLCSDCDPTVGLTADDLSYVRNNPEIPDTVVRMLKREFRENKAQYDQFREKLNTVETNEQSVSLAMAFAIVTIKTNTDQVDDRVMDLMNGRIKSFTQSSTDGGVKWEKIHDWLTSDIPRRVTDLLNDGRINDAHALLAGRNPETGDKEQETYLRACKAGFTLYLLGYDRTWIDTRIYRNIPMDRFLRDTEKSHPDTEMANPYRKRSPRTNASKVPVNSHSGKRGYDDKTFIEDKLKWNVIESDALTGWIMDELADATGIDREVIPMVAFNAKNERTTTHDALIDRM